MKSREDSKADAAYCFSINLKPADSNILLGYITNYLPERSTPPIPQLTNIKVPKQLLSIFLLKKLVF
jgi:hypothetical protein